MKKKILSGILCATTLFSAVGFSACEVLNFNKDLDEKIAGLEEQIAQLQQTIKGQQEDISDFETEVSNLQETINEQQEEIDNFEELEKEIRRIFSLLKGKRWVCCTSHFVQKHCSVDDLEFAYNLIYKLARE